MLFRKKSEFSIFFHFIGKRGGLQQKNVSVTPRAGYPGAGLCTLDIRPRYFRVSAFRQIHECIFDGFRPRSARRRVVLGKS